MTIQHLASIHVCALRHVPEMVERTGARHLISAINFDLLPPTPATISRDRHLKLNMNDITAAQPSSAAPASQHVSELLDFVQSWDRQAPMLIHCFAGLSRSTAAAFISLCALNPQTPEETIAHALRRLSDTASPNRLFVTHADRALGRQGRMVAALNSMGQSRIAYECIPFGIEAHLGSQHRPIAAIKSLRCTNGIARQLSRTRASMANTPPTG